MILEATKESNIGYVKKYNTKIIAMSYYLEYIMILVSLILSYFISTPLVGFFSKYVFQPFKN